MLWIEKCVKSVVDLAGKSGTRTILKDHQIAELATLRTDNLPNGFVAPTYFRQLHPLPLTLVKGPNGRLVLWNSSAKVTDN